MVFDRSDVAGRRGKPSPRFVRIDPTRWDQSNAKLDIVTGLARLAMIVTSRVVA